MSCAAGPSDARQLTLATTHHRAQQIWVGFVIAAGELLVLLKLGLHRLKFLFTHNRGDACDLNPLLARQDAMALPLTVFARLERRTPPSLAHSHPPAIHHSGINRIAQDASDRRDGPSCLPAGRNTAMRLQP
jgi:hypothetical protein